MRPRPLPVAVALVGALFAVPPVYLVVAAAAEGPGLVSLLTSSSTLRPLLNSLTLGVATAVACAVLGTGLALLVGRTDLPGARGWRVALALPLVIPSFVAATALVAATGPGGLLPAVPRPSGFTGSFVVLTLLSYPYVYLPVLARLSATPATLEEVSRSLGHGSASTMVRVVLPQLRNAILSGSLLVFLYALSEFGAVVRLGYNTLTQTIYAARLLDRGLSLSLGLLLAVIAVTVAFAARVRADRPVTRSGREGLRYRLGAFRAPALVVVSMPLLAAVAAPVAVFVTWVARGSSTVGVGYTGWGDELAFLVEPTAGSTVAGLSAAAAAGVLMLPVAVAAVRMRSVSGRVTSTLVSAAFALPGLVIALALASWAVHAPGPLFALYQSFPLLILAYVLHFGVQALRAGESGLAATPASLDEAAATLGAGPPRRFLAVDVPLMLPALLAGSGLVLLSTLKELPATLLLSPTGFETLATRIWNAAEDGFFAEVGITSLVLIALSAALTWVFVLRRGVSR